MVAAMISMTAPRTGHGHGPMPRFVLRGSLMAAWLILGLLLMHGPNLHGTPAEQHRPAVSVALEQTATGGTGVGDRSIMQIPAAHPCGDCAQEEHPMGAVAGCVLALFVTLLLLRRPRTGVLPEFSARRIQPKLFGVVENMRGRAPSLHALGINRR